MMDDSGSGRSRRGVRGGVSGTTQPWRGTGTAAAAVSGSSERQFRPFLDPFRIRLWLPVRVAIAATTAPSRNSSSYCCFPCVTTAAKAALRDSTEVSIFCTEWSGGLHVSPTIVGSRPGSLIAGAWAAMLSLGREGNIILLLRPSHENCNIVKEIPKLFIIGRPDMTIVAFGSN
ncbi:Pyridoxal phosphate-dependent transferase, partial [Cynara cardunculus var. scolymus]